MRHLILLNKTSEACSKLAQVCNEITLISDDELWGTGDFEEAIAGLMASIEVLGAEYDLDKDTLLPLFISKVEELETMIEELQSKSPSQSEGLGSDDP